MTVRFNGDVQIGVKALRDIAIEHTEKTGHPVWTHFRNPLDFHVECFTCQGRETERSD